VAVGIASQKTLAEAQLTLRKQREPRGFAVHVKGARSRIAAEAHCADLVHRSGERNPLADE
jgi:hypothetical protein